MPDLALVVVLALAAYRVQRLLTHDSITDEPRAWLYRWAWEDLDETNKRTGRVATDRWPCGLDVDGNPLPCHKGTLRPYAYELLTCVFCVGVWTSAGAYVLWALTVGAFSSAWVLAVPAVAGAQSLLALVDGALQKASGPS